MKPDKHDFAQLLRANRRLTFICLIQFSLIALLTLVGWQFENNELTLRQLRLVDSKGRERVLLRGGDDGPGLILMDSKGKLRAGLTVDGDLPGLRYYDGQGHARAGFEINPTGPNLDFLAMDGRYIERFPHPTMHGR